MAVVVCSSANNMIAVADQIPGKKYVYADNDASGAGEAAAIKTGLPYCTSGTVGNDANDDHQQFGLMAVVQRLMDVRLLGDAMLKRSIQLHLSGWTWFNGSG